MDFVYLLCNGLKQTEVYCNTCSRICLHLFHCTNCKSDKRREINKIKL